MGINGIWQKLRERLKKTPKAAVYIAAAALCTLLLLAQKSPKTGAAKDISPPEEPEPAQAGYTEALEKRLEEIIGQIEGAGEVSVMITVGGSEEKVYKSDVSESDSKRDEKTVVLGSKDAILTGTRFPEVLGVLVVCSGGDRPAVQEKVVNAVATVLNISTGKVYVANRK